MKRCVICFIKIEKKKRIGEVNWKRKKTCSNPCKYIYYSQLYKGKSGRKHTELEKQQISQKLKGRKKSKEMIDKLSKTNKGRKSPWLSKRNRENSGNKSWNWQGGISPINSRIRMSQENQEWIQKVLWRDNYACVKCGSKKNLQADHIKPFSVFPGLRFDINNGQTLCKDCHKIKTKEDWITIKRMRKQNFNFL